MDPDLDCNGLAPSGKVITGCRTQPLKQELSKVPLLLRDLILSSTWREMSFLPAKKRQPLIGVPPKESDDSVLGDTQHLPHWCESVPVMRGEKRCIRIVPGRNPIMEPAPDCQYEVCLDRVGREEVPVLSEKRMFERVHNRREMKFDGVRRREIQEGVDHVDGCHRADKQNC
jgi:hypothetical protein